jgi:hypothetical protein
VFHLAVSHGQSCTKFDQSRPRFAEQKLKKTLDVIDQTWYMTDRVIQP